jgi:hypothetical protein
VAWHNPNSKSKLNKTKLKKHANSSSSGLSHLRQTTTAAAVVERVAENASVTLSGIAPLERVLAYRNPDVIDRFLDEFDLRRVEAEEIFREMLKWLWLCARRREDLARGRHVTLPRLLLLDDLYAVDQMWHSFLMFTDEYGHFCSTRFGFYVHHYPITRDERQAMLAHRERDPDGFKQERAAILRANYSYIYDELGPETLKRWCEEFPVKYAKDRIKASRL